MISPKRVEQLVRAAFAPWPVEKVDVAETEDHDGEPVFKVTVGLRRVADDLDLRSFIPVENRIRDAAWAEGNRAFIHIYKQFDPAQDFIGLRTR